MEVFEHRGRRVTLDAADRGKGWTWTFQIDTGPVIANEGEAHPSEALARLEAIAVAQREIENADGFTSRALAPSKPASS
jgi:hypothetical protein